MQTNPECPHCGLNAANWYQVCYDRGPVADTRSPCCYERQLSALREKLARYPADWTEDSSLETWFPFTAQELAEVKQQAGKLREALEVILKGSNPGNYPVTSITIRFDGDPKAFRIIGPPYIEKMQEALRP